MENNLSISNSKSNLKWVFIILLVMIALTEMLIYKFRFEIIDHPWIKMHLAQQALLKKEWKYMILADSGSLVGIDPRAISKDLGNLSFPSCQTIGPYLLLKRYLKTSSAPKMIFFNLSPEGWGESFFFKEEFIRYSMNFGDFLIVWNDLTYPERICFLTAHFMPSSRNRVWINSWLATRITLFFNGIFSPKAATLARSQKTISGQIVLTDQGFILSPESERSMDEGDIKNLKQYGLDHKFTFSARNLKYFDLFVKLAHEKGIEIVFYEGPIPEVIYSIRESTGYNNSYRSLISEMKRKYDFVIFDGSDNPVFSNEKYTRNFHLNKTGAEAFTALFRDKIFFKYARESKH